MSCHHTWHQVDTTEAVEDGVTVRTYVHECPACGKRKRTKRAINAMPTYAKWKRELEKLVEKAWDAGLAFDVDGKPLTLDRVSTRYLRHEDGAKG